MPFDFMKKKTSSDKGEAKIEATKSTKQNAKAMGFQEAEDSLKPDKDPKDAKRAMPSLRHALKVGKKDVDPAQQAAVTKAVGPIDQAMSYALNIGRRAGSFNADAAKEGATNPELAARVARLASACKKFDGAGERLLKAHQDYMKRGFMTPLKAAIDDVVKAGMEVRILLTGLQGPGDSVAEGSLTADFFFAGTVVNGVQAGDKDTAAGKVPAGPAKGHDTSATPLPAGGGGYALWARAIRGYAIDYVSYFDRFAMGVGGL